MSAERDGLPGASGAAPPAVSGPPETDEPLRAAEAPADAGPARLATGGIARDALLLSKGELAEEFRDLLEHRCRVVFRVALVTVAVLVAGARLLGVEGWGRGAAETALDGLQLTSFAAALLVMRLRRLEADGLMLLALGTLALNAIAVALQPRDYPIVLGAALLLFVPAAVVPWRPAHQLALSVITLLAYLAVRLLDLSVGPSGGAPASLPDLPATLLALGVLAATSTYVTHTLYSLRTSATRARRLGAYIVERELARGGMSRVLLAEHARMCRPAAIKVLAPQPGEDPAVALARFEREVRLASTLSHPNTITIFDYGRSADEGFYYAMEFLEGWDLDALVRAHGPLPPGRALHVLAQACASLAEAHARGIVHRDLKPSNLYLTRMGGIPDFVKVLDFGIAKSVELNGPAPDDHVAQAAVELTGAGAVLGTPNYIAPEAITRHEAIGPAADLYSLGGVGYYLLTGSPPFQAGSLMELLACHLAETPAPPSSRAPGPIAPALDALVLRCLEKKPEHRPGDIAELEAALRALATEHPWGHAEAAAWWAAHPAPPARAVDEGSLG